MGNLQMKRNSDNGDIISKKSLEVLKEVILLLKQHSREEGLFRRSECQVLRKRILRSLKKGKKLQISNTPDTAKECAAALQLYLSQMKRPVMPERVQQLILADNPGVTDRTIAHDALGLIRQDVIGRHSELLVDLLGLLKHLLIFPSPTELTELQAPPLVVTFLPVFFKLTSDNIVKWRRIASRFNELIIEAPEQLMYKKDQSGANNIEMESSESNSVANLREFSIFHPFIRLLDNRNNYQIGETARALVRPLQRPLVGRLHPIVLRSRI